LPFGQRRPKWQLAGVLALKDLLNFLALKMALEQID
jgi:hypothetical protein